MDPIPREALPFRHTHVEAAMAFGLHWEWRGFGSASTGFSNLFGVLEPAYGPHDVEDVYIWLPHLSVNAKIRMGTESGLKFKRIRNTDADLEQWSENPDEAFPFPLSPAGWETLTAMMAGVDVALAPYPSKPPDGEKVLAYLNDSGCRVVDVHKRREGRLWNGPSGKVVVEFVEINKPEKIVSVGLESCQGDSNGEDLSDHQAKGDLLSAIEHFGLHDEPLRNLNYMNVVTIWANGGTLLPGARL